MINIFSSSDYGQELIAPSQMIGLTTQSEEVRFAETIVNKCMKID
jgi:hypothetical protein